MIICKWGEVNLVNPVNLVTSITPSPLTGYRINLADLSSTNFSCNKGLIHTSFHIIENTIESMYFTFFS